MTERLTRGRFLATGVAAVGPLAVPALARAVRDRRKTVQVYRLDPHSERCGGGKGACHACVQHDANSLFPTHKAAEGNRAHTGCDCCVTAGSLDYGTYVALFGNPKHPSRYRADLRSPRVRALLQKHPALFD